MGASPGAVAVDGRTGRALVLSTAGARPPGGAAHLPGTVSVRDATRGRVLRSVVAGATPWAVAVEEATQRAFVANADDGTVSVLDVRRGAGLHTIGVSANPLHVAVDEQAGRAFVVTSGGTVAGAAAWWVPRPRAR